LPLTVSALAKNLSRSETSQPPVDLITRFTVSKHAALYQRSTELLAMTTLSISKFKHVLNGNRDIDDVDYKLSFLDAYVNQALKNGAKQYVKRELEQIDTDASKKCSLFNC
jgi:hypothetical protein